MRIKRMKKFVKASTTPKYIKMTVDVSDDLAEPIDVSNDPDDTMYSVDTFEDYMEFMNRYKL